MAINRTQKRMLEFARMHSRISFSDAVGITKLDGWRTQSLLDGLVAHGCIKESDKSNIYDFVKITPKPPGVQVNNGELFK